MKTTRSFKRFIVTLLLGIFFQTNILTLGVSAKSNDVKIVYPIQEISELECRFEKFSDLSAKCKRSLPILKTKDYEKYAKKDGGYNDYTRIYTVLWGSSYKYGWDVGFGGHQGTDIATAEGTPVYAMADGKVIVADDLIGWGKTVSIEHVINGKKIVSNYSHLSRVHATKGTTIRAGEWIGEVGNTGNSFGNHLHFQIDLDTPFHPYYYDSKKCPYSYNQITEQGVCFDELARNTIDPLAFLESNGAILDTIEYTKQVTQYQQSNTPTGSSNNIFDKTVYVGYSSSDIKEVQQIYKDLGYYKGSISGDYNDVLESVIEYQIDTDVIENRESDGAGWFGPKTRAQTKSDYTKYLAKAGNNTKQVVSTVETNTAKTVPTVKKIQRTNLLTREEIEAKEMESFMRDNDVELKLEEVGGNIKLGQTSILKVDVITKKGRSYKGNLPATMTFEVDNSMVEVFPKSLYNFNRQARDIKITGLKTGNTTLKVKIGNKVVDSFQIKVYKSGETIYPETGKIYGGNSIVIGEQKTALTLMRDANGKRLINIPYGSTYTLKTTGVDVCLKTGDIADVKKIYKTKCDDSQFKNEIVFDYNDTVGGLLIFDYKATSSDASMELLNNYNNSELSSKNLAVRNPKGLKGNYVYHDEIIDMLESGVADGINKGYFLESRTLTKKDAVTWIENSLDAIESNGTQQQQDIDTMRNGLKNESRSNDNITREQFLTLAYDYLIFEKSNANISISYRDLDTLQNNMANTIFDEDTTWKDAFGDNYYRPGIAITRGEAAFLLSQTLRGTRSGSLASR